MATSRRSRESRRSQSQKVEQSDAPISPGSREKTLPQYNHNGDKVTKGIAPEGESGRKGIHPLRFLRICFRSSCSLSMVVNVLWPIVPIAIALHFARPEWRLAIFITNYIAMVPAANLIGFAGQELARKLPKVPGVILETTLGSIVEIILFMVLLKQGHDNGGSDGQNNVNVIRAAILGSILANLLLCLGLCFIAGGLKRDEQTFHEGVSEAGSGLMLVAGMGLILPAVFNNAARARIIPDGVTVSNELLQETYAKIARNSVKLSRGTAVILLVAYLVFLLFQTKTHDTLFEEIYEQDEHRDEDRHKDLVKEKLTLTECIVALVIAIACVAMIAVFLVEEIEYIVEEHHVKDAFVGLILLPVVEKAAEHLTAIDEAWDNQMNFALAHVLGATIQTALLNTPLVIIVGWCIGTQMDLNFEIFDCVALILAILVVGGFLRDGKSNYLEGSLCVFVYIIIAISAFYYPNPFRNEESEGGEASGESAGNATEAAIQAARMLLKL